ncbi:hypothetical protein AGDE_13084 [Angomonas deanei]|uniref:Uncharacterized protein n=1 Tax=Angomonas deanei TaxID=59799 RepID=A0A7G2CHZ1_9TRYP|nr:hypothetical protein AGDE_13084 [Angomonas deanei]CAD2218581.1 hypothetical protein, conserved [Angomonas deanei]|eukprot:EPY22758.1 hypothetical protein AGDE_13084 [Angomonas deanei]
MRRKLPLVSAGTARRAYSLTAVCRQNQNKQPTPTSSSAGWSVYPEVATVETPRSDAFYSGFSPVSPPAPASHTPKSDSAPVLFEFDGKKYTDYHELLDDYEEKLEAYAEKSAEVVRTMTQKVKDNDRMVEEATAVTRRDFVCILFIMLTLFYYLGNVKDKLCAEMTHRQMMEKAKENSKVPWVKLQ